MDTKLLNQVTEKARQWLQMKNIDSETKRKIEELIDAQNEELIDAFYRDLEFGTGGLRGIMGVGSNRMNIYTVAMATQGLANYLKKQFSARKNIAVVIAHDNRHNGKLFSQTAANVFSSNGIKVFLFESLRPTPLLSFAIRYLKCQSGVVITASHNPKEYNGYKAYWEDGAQVIAPHDKNIIAEVQKIHSVDEINLQGNPQLIEIVGAEIDEAYIKAIKELSLRPDIISKNKNLKIVFTPIHGSSVVLGPKTLKAYGFENIIEVEEQTKIDGDFPTVKSPNPEEASALELALKKGRETDADLILATDPDADRVGIAVKNHHGEFVLFNGNQTATFLFYYLLTAWKEKGKINGKQYMVKTIVTTEILPKMAKDFGVEMFDVLTGFKYIADIIAQNEGKKQFIAGGEESYGYLAGEFIRDKDAIMACALIAEAAAWAKEQGKSVFEMLIEIYKKYGLYYEKLVNITKKGKAGADEINQMMTNYRANPPKQLNNTPVVCIKDYEAQIATLLPHGKTETINLPKSNVLQFILADESIVSVRPSGTEPKIKFYFGVRSELNSMEQYESTIKHLNQKIEAIKTDLGI
ncbi:MAG TPA: phospho-sugar mutase [Salinivirgaceae bacterium]|mgnify:CR=1 FL=1|nr:phospho-sugar mutase [Salinivirgaceae bacterium]